MWTDDEVRMLIDERKEGNDHYHSLGGGSCKRAWWTSTAAKINQRYRTTYTGRQASEKFHGIVKDCRLMELSLSEDPRGKQTRNGERYHVEFRSGFWKKPKLQRQRSQRSQKLQRQQQDPDQDHKLRSQQQQQQQRQDQLRSQQQQQQQHQQNSDHPDQDQKLRSLEDQKVVQIFDELLRSQQQQQDQQVVQVFDDELEREDSSQASQSSLAIWEIDDD
ncbi:hypothetical protein RhiirA5_434962 [Rhizophagus irregularis]|uniref:Uncharacterized protein n=2 Tax=Rhizophagus irregularis TaxID=588596 RepID=A0A2I1FJS2_9GLOM|nr:hypothetical protein RhiirA5_435081 [Rhizophagus irregularis]PKB96363.1 hypothetical protein RhiirA5_434962 [Rhizophagus irregularis]PKY34632.1 hypothetical protein RhiirB3_454536 [Rhizophagus irregularis]